MQFPTIEDLKDLNGKRVILRLDFNVPIQNGKVTDDYRIKKSMRTINFLRTGGAKILILAHIEGESDTLRPVFECLQSEYSLPISFCEDCLEAGPDLLKKMQPGEILLFDNIRLYDGEKKNDEEFAKQLAALGDIYINDAFSVSHRKHASIVGIPKYIPGYIGFQFEEEIKNLSMCFNPRRPFLFILGGAKFDTKLPLVEKFLNIADTIFVGGALVNDIYKAKGYNVGQSKISDTQIDVSKYIDNPKIMIPSDVVIEGGAVKKPTEILDSEKILDAGPETIQNLWAKIREAQFILWNGPLGNYENGYKGPTLELARLISEAATHSATIVGGGDTLAAIAELGLEHKFTFISTGGGAMLDYLAEETLPGLDAILKGKKA